MLQRNHKCSVMRAQLSILCRDMIGEKFRDKGADFCRVTLRMDFRCSAE